MIDGGAPVWHWLGASARRGARVNESGVYCVEAARGRVLGKVSERATLGRRLHLWDRRG